MGGDRLMQTRYQYSILSQERVVEMGHGHELTVYDDEGKGTSPNALKGVGTGERVSMWEQRW
jgi:hypothetical protein